MRAVRFLLPAELEMLEASTYYETQVAGLGSVFLAKVESAVDDLATCPETWPVVAQGIRRHLVHRFPYAVLYRIDPDEVVVLAVMHQRRRPSYWLDRL